MENYPVGYTIRTKSGRGRITYQPDWSKTQPWVTYYDGTAGRHFTGLPEAYAFFATRYNDPLNPITR